MTQPLQAPQSVLIANIRLIGDVLLTTPLIGLLRRAYPDVQIDVLANKGTAEFLRGDPRVREVILTKNSEFATAAERRHYLPRIFRKYDWALNLNASDRGNTAAALAGRRVRLGFSDNPSAFKSLWKRLLLTHNLPFTNTGHTVDRCAVIARALGLPEHPLEVTLAFTPAHAEKVERLLGELGVGEKFAVVHPFARWDYKFWRGEGFAEVSDHIHERYGLDMLWTSSPDPEEVARLREAAAKCKYPPKLCPGLLNLNEVSALLSRASLYLGLDTAVTHIAATHSARLPVVALYGPTLIERWHPWNPLGPASPQLGARKGIQLNGLIATVQKDWDCVPCGLANCDDRGGLSPCMQQISVAEVETALAAVWAKAGEKRDS
ncbi:MAG: glycosyltransferase family 9 protein [Verrucomicrobiota bacterium JB024]|nr:glycosyltransferase family 9 protein [Verrucomicrobiota bacterium JB024]